MVGLTVVVVAVLAGAILVDKTDRAEAGNTGAGPTGSTTPTPPPENPPSSTSSTVNPPSGANSAISVSILSPTINSQFRITAVVVDRDGNRILADLQRQNNGGGAPFELDQPPTDPIASSSDLTVTRR